MRLARLRIKIFEAEVIHVFLWVEWIVDTRRNKCVHEVAEVDLMPSLFADHLVITGTAGVFVF